MNELYHYGVKGQKWGVRRYQNKDGSLTNVGKKRYGDGGKVYAVSGKVNTTDGQKSYVATVGTKNAKGGGNIGNIYGSGSSKKEAVRNAEYELKKYLDEKNDPHYESKSTEKLRNKIQNQNFKDLKKMSNTKGEKRSAIMNNNPEIRDAVNKIKESKEKWYASEEKRERVADKIKKDVRFDKKVDEEFDRIIKDYKKRGYRDDYIDRDDVLETAVDRMFVKHVKNHPEYRKADNEHKKNISDYHSNLENATKTILGKYGNRPISVGDPLRSRTVSADNQLGMLLKRNALYD